MMRIQLKYRPIDHSINVLNTMRRRMPCKSTMQSSFRMNVSMEETQNSGQWIIRYSLPEEASPLPKINQPTERHKSAARDIRQVVDWQRILSESEVVVRATTKHAEVNVHLKESDVAIKDEQNLAGLYSFVDICLKPVMEHMLAAGIVLENVS